MGRREAKRPAGQALVEFAIVAPVLFMVIFFLISASWASWQRSDVDRQIQTLGYDLPQNWQSMDPDDLVRWLILDGSALDGGRLTVSNATARLVGSEAKTEPDGLSQALGGSWSEVKVQRVQVTADVAYDLGGTGSPVAAGTWRGHVEREYQVSRRYELG